MSLVSDQVGDWCYLCEKVERVAAGETVEIANAHAMFMHVAENMVRWQKRVGEYPTTRYHLRVSLWKQPQGAASPFFPDNRTLSINKTPKLLKSFTEESIKANRFGRSKWPPIFSIPVRRAICLTVEIKYSRHNLRRNML